jgi:hypothetical protein
MVTLSTTEIAILVTIPSAIIAAVVSVLTTRYTVKHGPNYSGQITDIHASLAALAKTQDELKHLHASALAQGAERLVLEDARAEAARWKPTAKILSKVEGNEQVNILRIEASEEFALLEVSLLGPGGAKVHEFSTNGSNVTSKGFSHRITQESLVRIANVAPSYFQTSTFNAALRYVVSRKGQEYTGEIPFHAQSITVGNTLWLKITG